MSDLAAIDEQKLCEGVLDPLLYLTPQPTQTARWKDQLSELYDHIVAVSSHDENLRKKILLPKLLVGSFDEEQIWQQIELMNGALIGDIEAEIQHRLEMPELPPEVEDEEEERADEGEDGEENEGENDEEDMEAKEEGGEDGQESGEDVHESGEEEEEEEGDEEPSKVTVNLADMDKFCEEMEKDAFNEDEEKESEEEDEVELGGGNIFLDEGDDAELSEEESKLEKELKKVQAKIAVNEEEAMAAKSWRMKGEASQGDRDMNTLLEEDLQFDHGHKAAPEITLDTTNRIEKIVLERIKMKLFDDVERKEKPAGRDVMKLRELPLNQEKSTLSLAQVYEKEYVEAQAATEATEKEEVNEEEEKIKTDLANLFRKLDALSNFNFTPKSVKEELKIVVDAPAIEMEEAMPTAVAETQILAPAEVKAKQREELRADGEQTKTDKKRKRRKIKKAQSQRAEEREVKKRKKERAEGGVKAKSKKDAVAAVADEVKQGIKLAKKSSEKVNSNFFSKLQQSIDQPESSVKKKKKAPKEKKFSKFG